MHGIKRFLVLLISITFCGLMQLLVFPSIPYLVAIPNMMLIEVFSAGFLFGRRIGLITGVVCGLILDILGTGTPGFYTLILAWLGYGDGFLSEKMESEIIPVLYVILVVNEFLYHLYVYVFAFLIRMRFSFIPYFTKTVFPEFLLTMVIFLVVYGILIFVSKRLDLEVNKGEVRVV